MFGSEELNWFGLCGWLLDGGVDGLNELGTMGRLNDLPRDFGGELGRCSQRCRRRRLLDGDLVNHGAGG